MHLIQSHFVCLCNLFKHFFKTYKHCEHYALFIKGSGQGCDVKYM